MRGGGYLALYNFSGKRQGKQMITQNYKKNPT